MPISPWTFSFLVGADAVVAVSEFNGHFGHLADGLVDLADAGQGDDEQHRHDGDAQQTQGGVQLAEGDVDVLDLPHKDEPAFDDAVAAVQGLSHGDSIDMIGELQVLLADFTAL